MPNTSEEYGEIAKKLWKANQTVAIKLAETLYAKNQLPPAAPILIKNLAALLAQLQHQSFLLGSIATLYMLDNQPTEPPALEGRVM